VLIFASIDTLMIQVKRRIFKEKKTSKAKFVARLQTADSPPEDVAPQR